MRKSLWVIPLLLSVVQVVSADTIYTYAGNDFTNSSGGLNGALTCPDICSIDGSFTVSTPLGNNFSGTVSPSSYDFYISPTTLNSSSGAFSTWTNLNGAQLSDFQVVTNGTGAITEWYIVATSSGDSLPTMSTCNDINICSSPNDTYVQNGTPMSHYTYNQGDPGQWTVTPELPTGVLTMTAVVLGLLMRKRIAQFLRLDT